MKKTVQPEQSCGTCKYARFGTKGGLYCHGDTPKVINTENGPAGMMPSVGADFWGCRHYLYTAEPKILPATTISTKTN